VVLVPLYVELAGITSSQETLLANTVSYLEELFASLVHDHKERVFFNLSTPEVIEHIIQNSEAELSADGAVMVRTGEFTGRSPNDKYIVDHGQSYDGEIDWGKVNQRITPEKFDALLAKVLAYLQGRKIYVQDVVAGAEQQHQRRVRVVSEFAWSVLFSKNLFIDTPASSADADFLVIQAPGFKAAPQVDGTRSSTFVILDFEKKIILIGNTQYAGEIKKSVFTAMNRILPAEGVLPMHCSANIGAQGDTALFFGLSGTGKTTLSSDPDRALIGDDEHGWGKEGVFNFEGGCYAKTINLQREFEPLIWDAVHSFGSVLENVVYDEHSREIDFGSDAITENTRGAYDLSRIANYEKSGKGAHPKNIFFLSADAFGVLPPLAYLEGDQVLRFFLAGYTAKLAGTERGLGNEPVATFSSCFGAPFLPLSPMVYAKMLQEKIQEHGTRVWLVNTGWIGGAYGTGKRINLPYTRRMISAALRNEIDLSKLRTETAFGLKIPHSIQGIPEEILDQRLAWSDAQQYQRTAEELFRQFSQTLAVYQK
jgi:phosphoenolpyruvate carboxykinase (ATP)